MKKLSAYDAWFEEVKRIARLMHFSKSSTATIDKDAWKEYYDAGHTPAEAWREELSCV